MVAVGLGLAGLFVGSFLNALVSRLPDRLDWSFVAGRSRCPSCGHELDARDLVPVVSWLLLRGRCRYCGAPIEDSPLVELAVPALFVASYLLWPRPLSPLPLAAWLLLGTAVIGLIAYRLRG